MYVVKRDGKPKEFDASKIYDAVKNAFVECNHDDDSALNDCKKIADAVAAEAYNMIGVEKIQDMVESKLMKSGYDDVAKDYIIYRNDRTRVRECGGALIKKVMSRITASNVQNSNANVDENTFSGREKEASADVGKMIAIEYGGLSDEVAKAHKDMLVYQHDLEKAVYGVHNCLNLDFQELFEKGFRTRNGPVRPPKSFSTGCQQVAVAFQCQSQVQFGGVGSIHIDSDLAPLVKLSFYKHYIVGLEYIEGMNQDDCELLHEKLKRDLPSIDDATAFDKKSMAYRYAIDMLNNEGKQSTEALYHNLNTLESRQGSQVSNVA